MNHSINYHGFIDLLGDSGMPQPDGDLSRTAQAYDATDLDQQMNRITAQNLKLAMRQLSEDCGAT